jgi:16S rRNA (guanine966-N2)-methyltransferase
MGHAPFGGSRGLLPRVTRTGQPAAKTEPYWNWTVTLSRQKKRLNRNAAPRGSVRIIAGKWKRRRLKVVDAGGLRPTPDRVRETLFSWLEPRILHSRCLDLFAGTGALGFEAASRGASQVVMVERDPIAASVLREECAAFGAKEVQVVQADALEWLNSGGTGFDIVFLDPPYGRFEPAELCLRVDRSGRLEPLGLVYLETGADDPEATLPEGWRLLKSQRAGQVRYHLASRNLADSSS